MNEPMIHYRDFSLEEVQREFAPRSVHPNGDGFVVNPLPQEGPTSLYFPKTQPYYTQGPADHPLIRLINPTIAVPIDDIHAEPFIHTHDAQLFVRCGHLAAIGGCYSNAVNYRLDLRDFDTANGIQLIIRQTAQGDPEDIRCIRSPNTIGNVPPAWKSTLLPDYLPQTPILTFHRHIISEFEYIDYLLTRYDESIHADLREIYQVQLKHYAQNITAKNP